jgi:asparagine synthase (glutamine-hydrolysing)
LPGRLSGRRGAPAGGQSWQFHNPFYSSQADYLVRMVGRGDGHGRYHREVEAAYRFVPENERVRQMDSALLVDDLLYSLLHRNDRIGMMASIESRFPYLDEEMVRFGLNLPVKWKLRRTKPPAGYRGEVPANKYVLRAAAKGYLPPELCLKPKQPFPHFNVTFVRTEPGCFRGGYLSELLGLGRASAEEAIDTNPPEFSGRLLAVEVFGRLFEYGHTVEAVTEHVQRFASIDAR